VQPTSPTSSTPLLESGGLEKQQKSHLTHLQQGNLE